MGLIKCSIVYLTSYIIAFLEIPYKASVMTVMAIGGEILLLIVIALFGKEYWHSMKHKFKRVYSTFKDRH
ncbi:transporter suffix domain-containing protein [Acinetobacter bereziniae]|uniref:transporter suffix domain-containing protein n=1 Tax=Acinetobacter bereziniae TaxID=106648 RepID=UPI003AF7F571